MRISDWSSDVCSSDLFECKADPDASIHANWYRSDKSYWTERFNQKDDGISVEEEDRDPTSLLSLYRRLLDLRHRTPAFEQGDQRVLESAPGLLVVERTEGSRRYLIISNLTDHEEIGRASCRERVCQYV